MRISSASVVVGRVVRDHGKVAKAALAAPAKQPASLAESRQIDGALADDRLPPLRSRLPLAGVDHLEDPEGERAEAALGSRRSSRRAPPRRRRRTAGRAARSAGRGDLGDLSRSFRASTAYTMAARSSRPDMWRATLSLIDRADLEQLAKKAQQEEHVGAGPNEVVLANRLRGFDSARVEEHDLSAARFDRP